MYGARLPISLLSSFLHLPPPSPLSNNSDLAADLLLVPGTVYEGRCRGLHVAIKVLNDQKMDEKSLKKFKDEVELMA